MSRDARRLPTASVVDLMHFPPSGGVAGRNTNPAPVPVVRAGGGLAPVTVRERLLPVAFADRVATAERAAFARGVAEGERNAASTASARVDVVLGRLAASIDEIGEARVSMLQESERDLVRLALAMAAHVLRRQVQLDPSLLVSMARTALERLGGVPVVTIHLNPIDVETISRLRSQAGEPGPVDVVADPAIQRGGCLARTAGGSVDAGIDAQFHELTRVLLGETSAPPPGTDAPGAKVAGPADDGVTEH